LSGEKARRRTGCHARRPTILDGRLAKQSVNYPKRLFKKSQDCVKKWLRKRGRGLGGEKDLVSKRNAMDQHRPIPTQKKRGKTQ